MNAAWSRRGVSDIMVASRFDRSRPPNVVTSARQIRQTVYPVGAHSHDTDHRADFGTVSLIRDLVGTVDAGHCCVRRSLPKSASRRVMLRGYGGGRLSREQWGFGTAMTMTRRIKTLGAALFIILGLLNFHVPHFILERSTDSVSGASWLELVFVAVVLGAMTAAVGMWCARRWGWLLGVVVVVVALALYVTQESVGLPGMPQNWLEPSRIVSLIFDALFVAVAWKHVASRRPDLTVADH